ncbi:type VI secretion system contractile sheath small subunit [bacterium]|nr:type VI secretion system contractile sheath small subunit [bacterium]MBU1752603.1 type VI secretion system contractile sheath small subunit [bacterium]
MSSFQDEIPPSRINVKYVNANKGVKEEVELPLKLLLVGDYTLQQDSTPIMERKKLNITKSNFSSVMKEQRLKLSFSVPNKLGEGEETDMKVDLKLDDLGSFSPEAVVQQIPELNAMLKIRDLLKDLKARVVTNREFRKALEEILKDNDQMNAVLEQLDKIAPLTDTVSGQQK